MNIRYSTPKGFHVWINKLLIAAWYKNSIDTIISCNHLPGYILAMILLMAEMIVHIWKLCMYIKKRNVQCDPPASLMYHSYELMLIFFLMWLSPFLNFLPEFGRLIHSWHLIVLCNVDSCIHSNSKGQGQSEHDLLHSRNVSTSYKFVKGKIHYFVISGP